MDNNMSAAAYMHRIGGSPSTSSTSTGSSAGDRGGGGGVGGGGGGGRMAVIGVTRNVRLRRRGPSGFGFSLRGGREYAAGFYVSDVQPGGEAHRNGLRIGDQIIRVNGYPVEDAVHQEVALLAKNQQVLVLKIRSVGMIPVKDNPNDPVTWHIVQQQQQQQLQFNETGSGTVPLCTELQIRIPVGEQGRLGCSVCRGIIPGLTVQGTKEGGLARAAGLKAGDVIVWCNGQRLIDLPFERAIEVMRGAAVLNLIVNRPISNHLYDCPESLWMRGSSGYDSESSSLAATSPPSPQHHGDNRIHQSREEAYTKSGRICCPLALSTSSCSSSSEWSQVGQSPEWTRKVNNTTVIKVNQNPYQRTSYEHVPHYGSHGKYEENLDQGNEPLYDPVAPRMDYEIHDFDANLCEEIARRSYQRENGTCDITYNSPVEVRAGCCGSKTKFIDETSRKDNDQQEGNRLAKLQFAQRQTELERKTVTTVDVHHSVCPPAPPSMPPLSYKWQADAKPMNAMGLQMGSTMSMGSTGSTETESSLESSCGKDSASTSSSLSTSSCEPASTVSFSSTAGIPNGVANNKMTEFSASRAASTSRNSASTSTDLSSAITQELQRRAQQRSLNNVAKNEASKEKMLESRKQQNPEATRVQEQKMTHDKLMEEFKRAHRRMFNAAQQRVQFSDKVTEQEQERRTTNGASTNGPPPPPLPLSSSAKAKQGEDAVEMQSIESFKLKESPSHAVPKPPSTYFPLTSATTTTSASSTTSSVVGKVPLVSGNNQAATNGIKSQANDKDALPGGELTLETKKMSGVSLSGANKQNVKPAGKVAIRIGAYEGETKQPSRLEFLPQAPRGSEKGNDEELANGPVVSRLQNELAVTLQRSNLKKKTDGDNATIKSTSEIIAPISSTGEDPNRAMTLMHSDIEKLATALSNNKVTIKVNPENGSR